LEASFDFKIYKKWNTPLFEKKHRNVKTFLQAFVT